MESLKKVISLNQAAKISGYHQDYLGFLIRKGEIKGRKVGRAWFTTEEEIRSYVFKQKVKHDRYGFNDFFSRNRIKKILMIGSLVFLSAISIVGISWYLLAPESKSRDALQVLTPDVEVVVLAKE